MASEKKMNQFIEQAALKDEKRISIDSLLEVLYIIGRSFTVWIYFFTFEYWTVLLISKENAHTHILRFISFPENVDY